MIKIKGENLPFTKLLPNIVTLASLCIGLTAIKCAIFGEFVQATALLLTAGFMDGVDGRLARFLNSTSDFGAQLDSLVDFVNFGVVPGFIIYSWVNSYDDIAGFNWIMVLFFAICGAIRLARFNVDLSRDVENPILEKYFFKGVPIPCGAALTMLPMVLTYEFGDNFYSNPVLVITYTMVLGVLMASRVPTISIKRIPVKNDYVYLTLLVLGLIIAGLFTKPWITLAIVGITYASTIPMTIFAFVKITLSQDRHQSNRHHR